MKKEDLKDINKYLLEYLTVLKQREIQGNDNDRQGILRLKELISIVSKCEREFE